MTFGLLKGCWRRRWFRRITYVLISGAVVTGATLWTVRQPFLNRWLITKLDSLVRDETGLELQAELLEFHLFQGRVILRNFSVGGDLLKADRLEVQADFSSLFGHNPHIWNIELENPVSVLDAQRLARIHVKPRPDSGTSPQVLLDRFTVRGGKLQIQEPAWKLPSAQFTYRIYGQGLGPNRFATDIRVPRFELGTGPEVRDGSFSMKANLSDLALELKESEIRLGSNRLSVRGNYAFDAHMLSTEANGKVDLAELLKWLDPKAPRTWEGTAEFEAGVRGLVADPTWKLSVHGKDLGSRTIRPGEVEITAQGGLDHATIQKLTWSSPQGNLTASGRWRRRFGSQLQFQCRQVGLAPLAAFTRIEFLERLSVDLKGNADLPGDPWIPPQLDALSLQADGQFIQAGETMGSVSVNLIKGLLELPKVALGLPEMSLTGSGTLRLGKKSISSISAQAKVETDAALVAEVLQHWEIGEGTTQEGRAIKLGMSGAASTDAEIEWNVATGVRLHGQVEVATPRWHGATMDHLRADVAIQDDELRVDNIAGEKDTGNASGSLWLTWRKVPVGQNELDMSYQAFNLPIEEGLRAADVGDLPITGQGSGWARIYGPYDRLQVAAGATAQGLKVYGLSIPFGSGEMVYDLAGDRLVVKDARVAETAEQLGAPDEDPAGLLALRAAMDMDLKRETWQVWAKGNVDSKPLGLPGPRFQALVDARFAGPWVSDFGSLQLPVGSVAFSRGRVFLDQQSLEGFEGKLETGIGTLNLKLGTAEKPLPVITLDAWRKGTGLAGALDVHLAPDSADTAHLAARLTKDLLKDGGLDLRAQGTWDPSGFQWQGQMENVVGHFDGFDLIQQEPARLQGNAFGAEVDLKLLGQAAAQDQKPAPVEGSAQFRVSGKVPFSDGTPLDLRLEGTAELAHLKSILDHVLQVDEFSLLAELRPEGTAQFDLKLGGPYPQPTLDGLLSLKAGRLEVRTYPQSVEDLAFNLHFHGRDLVLLESDPLRGRVAQGAFRAWGLATWDFGELSKYDLQTRLEDFQLRDLPEGFELYGTVDAVLQGTKEEGGILSGTLQARRMLYQADINLRDLILASAMGGSPSLLGMDPNDPLTHIDLDLDLVLSQPWEFDTNLLKLQGRPTGAFKIQGTLAEPGLKGKMDILPGGRLTNLLPAGDIVLERGTLEWTNPRVLYPTVDLQGRVDVPPYLVNLAIRGNLDGLEMKQSSTPSLRQDEITAILINPSLAPDIGALSGPATQTAISSGFANTGSGLVTTLALANFQESLRRTFKLDRVSVAWRTGSGGTSPETSVTVGKSINLFGYRTPVVFTHQKTGTTATTSGQVEWRFGNLVFQLGVSQSGANGAAPSGEIRHTWSPGW